MMEHPCDKCIRELAFCLDKYKREREKWEYRLETEHPNVDCSPRPPDLGFIERCSWSWKCPLKGGE